jgi:hypothetical protein
MAGLLTFPHGVHSLATTEVSLPPEGGSSSADRIRRRQRAKLLLLFALCTLPVFASYLLYYAYPPSGRANYGELIDPQRPVPALAVVPVGDGPASLAAMRGQWLLLQVDSGACQTACAEKLFTIRQLRTMAGKERTRIGRVWLVTDDAPVDARLIEAYEGTAMLRAERAALAQWLPVPEGGQLEDYLFLVDPLGNLMMRHARDGEPRRIHKDIARLLKASRIG